jgi:hypothetical protein
MKKESEARLGPSDIKANNSAGAPQTAAEKAQDPVAAYRATMDFLQSTMTAEKFAALERETLQEIRRGAERLSISEDEYIRRIGVFPSPGTKRTRLPRGRRNIGF